MMDKCKNIENNLNLEDLSQSSLQNEKTKEIIEGGKDLVLALEDMLDFLQEINKGQETILKHANTELSTDEIKSRIVKVKELFNRFKSTLNTANKEVLKELQQTIRKFHIAEEYYTDEILIDWFVISNVDEAIDSTYEICYKIRELIRKL